MLKDPAHCRKAREAAVVIVAETAAEAEVVTGDAETRDPPPVPQLRPLAVSDFLAAKSEVRYRSPLRLLPLAVI